MRFDVLVVGDANPDLVLRGDVRPRFGQEEQLLDAADLVLGGSAAITAMGCARLGLRTGLLAAVGDDVFGSFVRERLAERGVELLVPDHAQAKEPTGISVILSAPGDRAILTLSGAIPLLRPADVTDELIKDSRHVHVASLFLQPGLQEGLADVFARARANDTGTSLDTNWDPSGRWSGLEEILAVTDVFLPNAAELLAVSKAGNLHEAAAKLVAAGTTVVLKDGARGGRVWWPGGEAAAPGLSVDVVDTTGAGDSFNAGFLAARLGGEALPEAVAWAARAGSLSTRAAGGTAAQPERDELIPSAR
ncbi:carbohydrate kinase family protein [Dactylosporangium sp. CA-233914]|uniref:carbohydrate kinase family protein n=1 Tax=Dactylosporangium sp. CA-233914 TaxID=3239934 RepID=UPI003D90161A